MARSKTITKPILPGKNELKLENNRKLSKIPRCLYCRTILALGVKDFCSENHKKKYQRAEYEKQKKQKGTYVKINDRTMIFVKQGDSIKKAKEKWQKKLGNSMGLEPITPVVKTDNSKYKPRKKSTNFFGDVNFD